MDVEKSRKGRGLPVLIAALLLSLVCSGCVATRSIADRVLQAPNQHIKIPKGFQEPGLALATNFPVQRIAVGPPPATLDVMIMEPGDYHVPMRSTFTLRPSPNPRAPPHYDFHFTYDLSHFSPKPSSGTNNVRGTIFLLPGYGLDKEAMVPWGLVLAKTGYRVVLVDLRGNGHSTGNEIYFGGIERTDMVQCLDALERRHVCQAPIGVLGDSYGAVVALQWAAIDPRVKSVVAISPYLNLYIGVYRYLKTFAPNLTWRTDRKVAADITRRLARFPDMATTTVVRQIKHPIFFVRSEHDEVCTRKDLNRLLAAAPQGSKKREVAKANHLLVGMCVTQLSEPVTQWFHRHLTKE